MELDYTAIGIRIRRFRKEMGLTQQMLAELSDQEPSNISHIERGATKLSLPTLVSIANALGKTPDDLLCDSICQSISAQNRDVDNILADCSHTERKILIETIRSLKDHLRSASLYEKE